MKKNNEGGVVQFAFKTRGSRVSERMGEEALEPGFAWKWRLGEYLLIYSEHSDAIDMLIDFCDPEICGCKVI